MFPFGPQYPPKQHRPPRPIRPHPMFHPPNPLKNGLQNTTKQNILSMFKTSEGNLDFEKITGTVQQISKLYGEVSPMISKFIKK